MGLDNVMIKLLSTARHHQQLQEFQPLSQTGDDTNVEHGELLADVSMTGEKMNVNKEEGSNRKVNEFISLNVVYYLVLHLRHNLVYFLTLKI